MYRIGHGFDAHKFGSTKPLMLAGVHVPYEQGLLAHSDGDVVIHALCDALLGAAALGDIGKHFSDQDERFRNIDSRQLLSQVMAMLAAKELVPGNLDITIIAQTPKLAPYIESMNKLLANDCQLAREFVNVKATTTEGMGYIGRKEGISVHAVVMLKPKSSFES